MASHFSKAVSACWLKEAVFGSRATVERCCTSYLSGQENLWDDLWTGCVPSPMVSVVILQPRALTAGACTALFCTSRNICLVICHTCCMIWCALVYLEAGGMLCHWFKEIPLSLAGSWKQLIVNGWHVQLLLMYGNRREIGFNWFNIMKKVAFILL